MNHLLAPLTGRFLALLLLLSAAFPVGAAAAGDEAKCTAVLIWGTNGEKPADKGIKEVDPKLGEKLSKIFKWKKYFEIKTEAFAVGPDRPKQVTMSKQCRIDVQNLGNSVLEVKLFGEGKLVVTKRHPLAANEPLILAGDGKDDTAWFVVITTQK